MITWKSNILINNNQMLYVVGNLPRNIVYDKFDTTNNIVLKNVFYTQMLNLQLAH